MTSDLSAETVSSAVTGRFGSPLRFAAETGSTNADGLSWAAAGAPEGALIVADFQRAGRGRRGRAWTSPAGAGLMFSLILRPSLTADRLGLLPVALGVACADAVRDMTGLTVQLKWPNDLMIGGKKLGGLLIESRLSGNGVDCAVLGAGINVHLRRDEMPDEIRATATSIAIELGDSAAPPSRSGLLGSILHVFQTWYEEAPDNARALIARASDLSAVRGRAVKVDLGNGESLEGRAVALRADGGLEVEVAGRVQTLHAGEITSLRPLDEGHR